MDPIQLTELTPSLEPTLEGEGFTEYRALVQIDEQKIPVLVRKRHTSRNVLAAFYNGALVRAKAPDGIVFQRSTWLDDINADSIHIADPTLVQNTRLTIGWGQGSLERWAIPDYVTILNHVREAFDLADSAHTLHYGSSAGGFQAAATATLDRGSYALVNNPQLDWSRYAAAYVNALLRDVFEGRTAEQAKEEFAWRINIVSLFAKENYIPPMEMLTNIASDGDFNNHFIPFLNELRDIDVENKTPTVTVSPYSDKNLGHNPLGKNQTLKAINTHLDRLAQGL
ncbi:MULTISPECIES: prolyl oligopeptidase family serine peptidase [Corynebacterium]|uniref:prolyl oligopeptidase family serine peptidase n=1 Tax=Corynebacterium TaxID=1716 RepID=UPI001E62E12F|nr:MULTISPECIES: prolyl oligopeptidase family serine peptidase [Corynebacterium]